MLEQDVLTAVQKYLAALKQVGIDVEFAVIFGSQAKGQTHEWSDIDLIVVSPQFDAMADRALINLLWRTTAHIDNRIEPIPCGSRQWREDDSSAIIEIARREGVILPAA
jgi:uncharacterized protein